MNGPRYQERIRARYVPNARVAENNLGGRCPKRDSKPKTYATKMILRSAAAESGDTESKENKHKSRIRKRDMARSDDVQPGSDLTYPSTNSSQKSQSADQVSQAGAALSSASETPTNGGDRAPPTTSSGLPPPTQPPGPTQTNDTLTPSIPSDDEDSEPEIIIEGFEDNNTDSWYSDTIPVRVVQASTPKQKYDQNMSIPFSPMFTSVTERLADSSTVEVLNAVVAGPQLWIQHQS